MIVYYSGHMLQYTSMSQRADYENSSHAVTDKLPHLQYRNGNGQQSC